MTSNPLPANPGALIVLAGKCETGLAQYAVTRNITQITVAGFRRMRRRCPRP